MTKNEMIKAVSERVDGATNKLVDEVLKAYADVVVDTLTDNRDEKLSIGNLGTFKVKHVPERSGVAALAGGKEWTKPAHDEICFKMSKSVKELA